jgi:DNA-binding NarL/FixJ family response regulator
MPDTQTATPRSKGRILVIDDESDIRESLETLLELEGYAAVTAENAAQGLKRLEEGSYDLVLLDISLPDQNGLNLLKLLQQNHARLPVIILSTHPEEHYAVRALRAGAAGYVNKGDAATVLKEAMERVLAGRRYVTSSQAELLADALSDRGESLALHHALSDREYQLACMMAAGKTLTEIARELSLSVKTVSTYRARVLEKLHLRSTADIINYCIQNGLAM